VGVVGEFEKNRFVDARVVDYGMRSVTAVPILDINKAKLYQLESVPGIGKSTAAKIISSRPFKSLKELKDLIGEDKFRLLLPYITPMMSTPAAEHDDKSPS